MASGNILDRFFPPGEPPSSNPATFAIRNQHPVMLCDAATDESVIWTSVLPSNYSGGGLTVRIYWSAASATSGNVVWEAAFERIDDEGQDTDSDGFASTQTATAAAPGTSGAVQYTDIAFTDGAQIDSLAVGELFRLKINRDANNGSDTMSGDAEIHAVTVRET